MGRRKTIDDSECVINFVEREYTMEDAVLDLFIEFVNEKYGYTIIQKKI